MQEGNLQLRNCSDCKNLYECDAFGLTYGRINGCEHFSSVYGQKKSNPTTNTDQQQAYLEGWQAGFKAGVESVLRNRKVDSFDREEEFYNDIGGESE